MASGNMTKIPNSHVNQEDIVTEAFPNYTQQIGASVCSGYFRVDGVLILNHYEFTMCWMCSTTT